MSDQWQPPAPQQPAGTSFSDLLTTAKNLVTALNQLGQNYLNVQGLTNKANISAATLLKTGPGRICTVSVTTAGSAPGHVYDVANASATTGLLYVIPNTVGVYVVNLPASYGIVVAPGSGQVVAASYS